MNWRDYARDQAGLAACLVCVTFFVAAMTALDNTLHMDSGNVVYMIGVCLFLFLLYWLCDFAVRRRHLRRLQEVLADEEGLADAVMPPLPRPANREQALYHELLQRIFAGQERRYRRLHQERQQQGEFLATWVHDTKMPIAVSRLLLEGAADKAPEELLSSLEEELDRIEAGVERVLYSAKMESFAKDYLIQEVCLEQVLKEAVKRHSRTFIAKRIRLDLRELPGLVLSDRKWLSFILDQILSNALKYTTVGGCIRVFSEGKGRHWRLFLEDNGIGIPAEDVPRIFDRGFTGRNGREFQHATGMGLYLAAQLADKLGHRLEVESKEGEYTRLIIDFSW